MNTKKDLSSALRRLGEGLGMPESSQKTALGVIQTIFERIKQHKCKLPVSYTATLGSAGKRTGLWITMDYDCVIFLKTEHPCDVNEYRTILKEVVIPDWKDALEDFDDYVKETGRGLKVELGGLSIDLVASFDVTSHDQKQHGNSFYQWQKMMEIIGAALEKSSDSDSHQFPNVATTALNRVLTQYMKSTEFCGIFQVVARLAKLWVYFAGVDEFQVRGKSFLIEIIAFEAVKRAQIGQGKNDALQCFEGFLNLLTSYEDLRIDPLTEDDMRRRLLQKESWSIAEANVFDPSNPYVDLCNNPNAKEFLQACSQRAEQTLERLHAVYDSEKRVLSIGSSQSKTSGNRNSEEIWLTCLRALYVEGAAWRHGIPKMVGRPVLYVSLSEDRVYFPEVLTHPVQDKKPFVDLLHFICYSAAFIPREVTKFDDYVECLGKCLSCSAGMGAITKDDAALWPPEFNFTGQYPVIAQNGLECGGKKYYGVVVEAEIC